MSRLPITFTAFVLVFIISGRLLLADEPKRPADSARVDGVFVIDAKHSDIDDVTLTIMLFESDPRLADAPAHMLDKVQIENVSHKKGKETKVKFNIGSDQTILTSRQYFVNCNGHHKGKRVYYGAPSHGNIGWVLTDGHPVEVVFNAQRLK